MESEARHTIRCAGWLDMEVPFRDAIRSKIHVARILRRKGQDMNGTAIRALRAFRLRFTP